MICENDLWKPSLRTTNAENDLIDFFLKILKTVVVGKTCPKNRN